MKSVESLNAAAAGPLSAAMGTIDRLYKRKHIEESTYVAISEREMKKWQLLDEGDRQQYVADTVRFCLLKHG